jgi:hypothetical protein
LYAVIISLTEVVSKLAFVILHGSGPAASTDYIVPTTSVQATRIAIPEIGLLPILPVINDL